MKILHVFRAPVGGLFRHVRDLCRGQHEAGHQVGVICDSSTGGATAENLLASAQGYCSLGVHRIPIGRLPGFGDLQAALAISRLAKRMNAEIIHGHGAKGGVYGRLAARHLKIPSVYTPHGGSLHYSWQQPAGAVFLGTEKLLAKIGSGVVFVCNYERDQFAQKVGLTGVKSTVVYNGLWPEEFVRVPLDDGATDILFMGDMRDIKGVDTLIEALALVVQRQPVTATFVGDGPQLASYQTLAETRGLGAQAKFPGRLPTRAALARGKILVMPSRSESFPYVILEAAAAERPIIASAVGGIPEILPADQLVPPEQPMKLASRIAEALTSVPTTTKTAVALKDRVGREFSAKAMADKITAFYKTLA